MYPYAYIIKNNQPGLTVNSVSYKQFFNPSKEKDATAFYFHRQGNSYIVYFDCHKQLKGKLLTFPATMVGKKITILEKTSSVKFTSLMEKLTADGILFNIDKPYGYFVLKLD